MSQSAVVRNYAETLLELGARDGAVETYGDWLAEVATLYRDEPEFRLFLETPRVTLEEKKGAVRESLQEAPERFLRFLLVVLDKRRHRFLPRIRERYRELVDEREDRIHATVTLAEEPDAELREEIGRELSETLDQEVIPHFRVDGEIVGGIVVRVGDRVMDGSLRRRLLRMKRQMMRGTEPVTG